MAKYRFRYDREWVERHTRSLVVFVDGPFPVLDRDGEEQPEWTVCLMDPDGCEVGTVYRVRSYDRACALGSKMSRDRRLELVIEAAPACRW